MALKNKYQREKQQYSNDGGATWLDVSPANYRRGRLIEAGSEDCNTVEWKEVTGSWFCVDAEPITKWVTVSGEFLCDTGNKYAKEKEQVSEDGGMTWTDTGNTRQGSLIKTDSPDCISYRWVEMENDYICIGNNKHVREKQQYSNDGGKTWTDNDVIKAGKIIESGSSDCNYASKYLTIEAVDDITILVSGSSYYYSKNGGETWTDVDDVQEVIKALSGEKILFKMNRIGTSKGCPNFGVSGRFNVYGNIMSMLYGDDFANKTSLVYNDVESTFFAMFAAQHKDVGYKNYILSAENLVLPATTLTEGCYKSMFSKSKIVYGPTILPATTLANKCYQHMFADCQDIKNTPILPATTLAYICYAGMFEGCTSLTTAPELPATTLAKGCYSFMFQYCKSLTSAPALPATTLATECYESMFLGCTSLVNAPELPATTLDKGCYAGMFYGCTSLETAPELPALNLVYGGYKSMFSGCKSLNYIKAMFITVPNSTYIDYWLNGVASTGTFVKNKDATWTNGIVGIPRGWTVVTE